MLIELTSPINDEELIQAIRYWLDLLARADYEEALRVVLHHPYYGWTPRILEEVINGYGSLYEAGGERFVVTDWRTAAGEVRPEIDRYPHPMVQGRPPYRTVADVYVPLPLNGRWSEVTAVFRVLESEGHLVLELNAVRML